MNFIAFLFSRFSTAQGVVTLISAATLAVYLAVQPVSVPDQNTSSQSASDIFIEQIKYADLADAIERLMQSGFIETLDAAGPGNTLVSQSLGSAGVNSDGKPLVAIPQIMAIVEERGVWTVYARADQAFRAVQIGEDIGSWQVESIAQGEVVLSSEDRRETIDVFGGDKEQ